MRLRRWFYYFRNQRFNLISKLSVTFCFVFTLYILKERNLTFENGTYLTSNRVSKCKVMLKDFDKCQSRMQQIAKNWKTGSCYAEWGIDGSLCSIARYLSEVERVCPVSFEMYQETVGNFNPNKDLGILKVRYDFEALYEMLGNTITFQWIKIKIKRMQKDWMQAGNQLSRRSYFQSWKKKKICIGKVFTPSGKYSFHTYCNTKAIKILILPGFLSDEIGWNIAEWAFDGGPLGELVQWADLISSLYTLGHDLSVALSTGDLKMLFENLFNSVQSHNCPQRIMVFDVIFCDIAGLDLLKKATGEYYNLTKCAVRVVDCFGTEPEYNHPEYADRRNKTTYWGNRDLWPKQFYTMFPHTPDNTFLGMVIETNETNPSNQSKQNLAVVYGKNNGPWKERHAYLDAIHELVPVHGTVLKQQMNHYIPRYVVNHGVLRGEEYHALLRSAKIFVGLGFPAEGPAALEAIADGAVFLNPIFEVDSKLYQEANEGFKQKPTSRRLTSQNSYAQIFIGPPHVRTVNMDDPDAIKSTMKDILHNTTVTGYMPYEFTSSGMLERIGFLIENQEFCFARRSWPPLSSLQTIISEEDESCVDACMKKGLLCEPHFFADINQHFTYETLNIKCNTFVVAQGLYEEIYHPSFSIKKCVLQGNPKLFSCAGRNEDIQRICPCRDFVKGQVAMCKDCYFS